MNDWDTLYMNRRRDIDEYVPLTRKESVRFWSIFAVFMLIDLALILMVSYGLDHGWYA